MNRKNSNLHDYNSKILLIGDSAVGKTSIMMRYVNDKFSSSFITTIGIDFVTKIIDVAGNKIRLQIWDTAGQERFRSITTSYFNGADIVIIIYDICDESSFENVGYWMDTIKKSTTDSTGIILVGNKIDMETSRRVSSKDGIELAKKYNVPFFECSAKKDIKVDSIFEEAGKLHLANFNNIIKSRKSSVNIKNKIKQSDKEKCCS
jgi:Ras-related protein Rab-8A